jgi:hypothetical protein
MYFYGRIIMKKLLALLLIALLAISVVSCSNEGNEGENEGDNQYVENTVIVTSVTIGDDTFHFDSVDSETVVITNFSSKVDAAHAVKIPAYLDGKRVVGIAQEAFCYKSSVLSLTFPTQQELAEGDADFDMSAYTFAIADYAFRDCVSLKSLTLPAYVSEIGVGAFFGCTSLETLTFDAGIKIDEIKTAAFMDCVSLTAVDIPASVATIGEAAFYGCSALATVKVNEGTSMILKQAFQNCSALANVELPASVVSIGTYAFHGSDALYIGGLTYAGTSTEVNDYIASLMLTEKPEEPVVPEVPEGGEGEGAPQEPNT